MVDHVLKISKSILWCGMGSGKTVSLLTAFVEYKKTHPDCTMLILAPKLVCDLTWVTEPKKWQHTKHLKISNMCGKSPKVRMRMLFDPNDDIKLLNYESLPWLSDQLNAYFVNSQYELPFNWVVYDEHSKMKRPESQRFADFAPLTGLFERTTGMTASPASNGLINLWGQAYVVDQGASLGVNYGQFKNHFFKKVGNEYGAKHVPKHDSRDMIVDALAPITIEISTSDTDVELPPMTVITRSVVLPPKVMRQYTEMESKLIAELESGAEVVVFNRAALNSKLQQISNGFLYHIEDETMPDVRTTEHIHSKKMDELQAIIDEVGNEPILLFYSFGSERDYILKKFPEARCLTGASDEESSEMVDEFNAGRLKLLIAHELSAGYGLNLQKSCSIIVRIGPSYNLEAFEQSVGRVYRQGQSRPVLLFIILSRDTIDLDIMQILEDKGDVQQDLLKVMKQRLSKK